MFVVLGILIFFIIPSLAIVVMLRCVYLEYRWDRVPILLYHRLISRDRAERGLVRDDEMIWVSYDTSFAEQMAYLREAGYTALCFDDYLAIRAGQRPMPPKPVILTFDDGYLSNYTIAYPVLKKYGYKATVFVSPEPDEHTRQLIEGIDGFLDTAQICEMVDQGVSIQSHTLTHCVLTELSDEAAMFELAESRRKLAEMTGRPVDHIAIPRAGYSWRVKRLVKEAGYKTACCNNKGSANGLSDLLALPRIVIERDMSIEDFARCLMPRASTMLRIVGNIKRIPERIGGAHFARKVRNVLYIKPFRPLFQTRNLKKVIAIFALAYLSGSLWFIWYLMAG